MNFSPDTLPRLKPRKVEKFTDKIRWLRDGWDMQGLARQLLRTSDRWVCRTHQLDWKRASQERIGHFDSGMVVSFLRHRQGMQYGGKTVQMNLRILVITTIDPASMKLANMNWPAATELANLLFAADAPWVWISESKKDGQLPNQQWACFYDEQWIPMAPPDMSLVGGSEYWSMHEHNKGEENGSQPS